MRAMLLALLPVVHGCGACGDEGPVLRRDASAMEAAQSEVQAPPPDRAPWPAISTTDDLWRRAPADATAGLVVADGAVGPLVDGLGDVGRLMERFAGTRRVVERWRASATERLGIDPFDPEALVRAGIDRRGGFAVFVGADARVLLTIYPVRDREAFSKALGGRPSADGASVDIGDRRCREVAGRFECVASGVAFAAPGDGGRLGGRALARDHRGAVELVGDGRRTRVVGRALRDLGLPYARAGWFELSVDLAAPGRADVHGFVEGRPVSRLAVGLEGRRAARGLFDGARGAAGAVRLVMAPASLIDIIGVDGEPLRVGNRDLRREFFDQLDGEVEIAARGDGVFAGELRAHLREPSRAARALPTVCKTLAAAWKARLFHPEDGRCRGLVDLATLPRGAVLPRFWGVERVRLQVEVDAAREQLVVRFADSYEEPAALADAVPTATWVAERRWHWVGWGRSFDPLATLTAEQRTRADEHLGRVLDARQADRLKALRWLAAHVAELAFAARLDADRDGIEFRALLDGFAGDEPAAYARYQRAVEASIAGDAAAYRRELRALAADYPNGRVARQWRLVEAGAPAMAASYLLSSFFFSRSPNVPRLWELPPPM